jgi:uncharacterized membrane protein
LDNRARYAIAYAIFRSGYGREALSGTIVGLVSIGVVSAILGTGLQQIPVHLLQIGIGIVLLWLGDIALLGLVGLYALIAFSLIQLLHRRQQS